MLATLIDRAQVVLDRATADDRVWLAVADGLPQRVTIPEAREILDTLSSWPVRMDLPATVSALTRALRDAPGLPPEIVVVSDLQATALHGRAEGAGR
ncbi:MAG: hypothetical protein GWO22_11625, partial [Actinobacteria bacterium]|nr:hypothetical protein [Actinomycetota bacterium]